MNRSYSHNFRTFGNQKNKCSLSRSSANFQFRTVWKTRDTHQLCNKPKVNKTPIVNTLPQEPEQPIPIEKNHETAAHQQMREFIKMMKKNSDPSRSQISNIKNDKKTKRTNLNIIYNQPNNQNTNNCQSSRSVRSSRSVQSSIKSIRDSKIQNCSQFQLNQSKIDGKGGLEILEKKIQDVIRNKLGKFVGKTKDIVTSRVFQDDIDKELKSLVQKVRDYSVKENVKNDDQIGSDIRQIGHKISIIQKAIASSSTQHEILKKYYSSTQKIRKNYATVDKNTQTHSISCEKFVIPSPPSIHYQTTSGTTYLQPSRNSYTCQGQKRQPYIPNRQPMPRSLYQREFLYYGIVPTYPKHTFHQNNLNKTDSMLNQITQKLQSQNKENPNPNPSPSRSTNKDKESSYKKQFKCKQVTLVNSKQLDCCRDKFKNLDVNFMGNKAQLASIYESNLRNAFVRTPDSQLGKQNRLKAKNQKHNKSTIQIEQTKSKTDKNNSFTKKTPQSANPSHHHTTESQLQQTKFIIPFNYKTQHQSQFKNPYNSPSRPHTSASTQNLHSPTFNPTLKLNQTNQILSKAANLTSQKGQKGVLQAYIKQKNLNNLKYAYKYQFAI